MITVTINDPLIEAAFAAAAENDGDADAQANVEKLVNAAGRSYRDQFAVDRITASAFVLRFTQAEYAALVAAAEDDPIIAGFVARIEAEPYVWLGSDEVKQGMAYIVGAGLVTQSRADAILAY